MHTDFFSPFRLKAFWKQYSFLVSQLSHSILLSILNPFTFNVASSFSFPHIISIALHCPGCIHAKNNTCSKIFIYLIFATSLWASVMVISIQIEKDKVSIQTQTSLLITIQTLYWLWIWHLQEQRTWPNVFIFLSSTSECALHINIC